LVLSGYMQPKKRTLLGGALQICSYHFCLVQSHVFLNMNISRM
jgi:hypothetical protein